MAVSKYKSADPRRTSKSVGAGVEYGELRCLEKRLE